MAILEERGARGVSFSPRLSFAWVSRGSPVDPHPGNEPQSQCLIWDHKKCVFFVNKSYTHLPGWGIEALLLQQAGFSVVSSCLDIQPLRPGLRRSSQPPWQPRLAREGLL